MTDKLDFKKRDRAFTTGDRAAWRWRAMIRIPDIVTEADLAAARAAVRAKGKTGPFDAVAHAKFTEGDCLQTLHIGPYSDEAPVLARLHDQIMPDAGLAFAGPHHEIYLSDPRKSAPEKLRTILRQPVRESRPAA